MRNLIISIYEKARLKQLSKAKYSILASILHIFQKNFLQSIIPTCTIHCKSHDFLISCFKSRHIFQNILTYRKKLFCHSFLNNIITIIIITIINIIIFTWLVFEERYSKMTLGAKFQKLKGLAYPQRELNS